MKKNKSLFVILSILVVLVLVIILSSTIFCLKNVEINFMNITTKLTNCDEEIISSGNFKYNQSIFFVDKEKYKQILEENNPYLKVVNLETIFPSTLVINAVEREELFATECYNSSGLYSGFLIYDDELKVLKVDKTYENNKLNAITLKIDGSSASITNVGGKLDFSENELILSLASELYGYNNNPSYLRAIFSEITLNYSSYGDVKIVMRSGTEILIKDSSSRFSDKFRLALSTYNTISDKQNTKIEVREHSDGVVRGTIATKE